MFSASFIFLMMFGMFAGTASAYTNFLVEHKKDGTCTITERDAAWKDGSLIEKSSIRVYHGKTQADGTCAVDNCWDPNPKFTPPIAFNPKVFPSFGQKNSIAVKEMQTTLLNSGIPVLLDGSFGLNTQRALMQYQARNGLTPSGLYDLSTDKLMNPVTDARCQADLPSSGVTAPADDELSSLNKSIDILKKELASITNSLSSLAQRAQALSAVRN